MLATTATDLPRLMTCNGSRTMGGFVPPVDGDQTGRDEGNAAHWLVETYIKGDQTLEEYADTKAFNGVIITHDMIEHVKEYTRSAIGSEIEVNTSFSSQSTDPNTSVVWEVNGRADSIKYHAETKTLYVSDLKYGHGIVEPKDNWTLIAHAIGWATNNPSLSAHTIVFTIYQPRSHHPLGHVRSWSVSLNDLRNLLLNLDNTLRNPSDVLQTSEHCHHCPAMTMCPAYTKAQMNGIDASERAFNDDIENDRLSSHLDHLKRAVKVLTDAEKAYKELAAFRLKKGEIINNYTLNVDLANRAWKPDVTPEMMEAFTAKDLTKKQMITPNQVEGKGVSKEFVTCMTYRKNKGSKLVRMSVDDKVKKLFNK